MSSSYNLAFVYVFASIFIGSFIITCLIKFIKFDIQSILSTKRGEVISSLAERIYERWLHALSVSDPVSPPARLSTSSSRGYLETLPQRTGPRPSVVGASNPKQTTQTMGGAEKDLNNRLRTVITTINSTYPHTTYLGRSTFEEGNITLFARHRVFDHTKYYGEILNADKLDGFMSTKLHPSDVRTVIERGWGQRHPLSSRHASWFLRLLGQDQAIPAPGCRVVLYAPRSQEDLEQIEQIIKAAVWWVGGIDSRVEQESSC